MAKRFRRNGENMDILNEAKKNFDYMVRIRRHMHEYPENSGVEYETVKYIASELDALGIEYVVVPEGGIIGQIHGGKPGKTVLLRADMDALPIKESKTNLTKEKVCISKNDGISHACGHDAHTAMLLAEAKILNENKEDLNGNIVLLFERGEEAGGNIRNLLPYAVETMKLKILYGNTCKMGCSDRNDLRGAGRGILRCIWIYHQASRPGWSRIPSGSCPQCFRLLQQYL